MSAPIRFLLDENLRGPLTAAICSEWPDSLRVQDANLRGAPDDEILAWAAREGYLLVSGDRRTLEPAATSRINQGDSFAGILLLRPHQRLEAILEDLALVQHCSTLAEWINRIEFIPF